MMNPLNTPLAALAESYVLKFSQRMVFCARVTSVAQKMETKSRIFFIGYKFECSKIKDCTDQKKFQRRGINLRKNNFKITSIVQADFILTAMVPRVYLLLKSLIVRSTPMATKLLMIFTH